MPSARALHRVLGLGGADSRQRIAMTGMWERALSAMPLIDSGASLRVGRGLERGGNFRRGSSNHHFILSSLIYTIPPMHELRSRSTRALPCVNCHAMGEWEADAQRLTRPPKRAGCLPTVSLLAVVFQESNHSPRSWQSRTCCPRVPWLRVLCYLHACAPRTRALHWCPAIRQDMSACMRRK